MKHTTALTTVASSLAFAAGGDVRIQVARADDPPPEVRSGEPTVVDLGPGCPDPQHADGEVLAPGAAAPAEARKAFARFAACMREHGVDLPDPPAPGEEQVVRRLDEAKLPNPASERFRTAEAACDDHLEDVVAPAPEPQR